MRTKIELNWYGPYEFPFEEKSGRVSTSEKARSIRWNSTRKIVYVLGFMAPYFVQYQKKRSSVCYVGSGNRGWRVLSHRDTWFQKVGAVLDGFRGFQVWGCLPRKGGQKLLYRDVECDVIKHFEAIFGEPPLFNQKIPNDYRWPDRYSTRTQASTEKIFRLPSKSGYTRGIKGLERRMSN